MTSDKTKIRRMKILIEEQKSNIVLCNAILKDDCTTELYKRKAKHDKEISIMSIEAAEFWLKCHENEDENN